MAYELIKKTIFFPEEGILAIGDLHLGYESMLKSQGVMLPFNQLDNTKQEIDKIIQDIKGRNQNLKKIILMGDIKHSFNFDKSEKLEIRDFLEFLEQYVQKKDIILIKGNHEKFELDNREYKDFQIENDIIFTHGDKSYPEILDKKIDTIVMAHLHPAITLKEGPKREKYKCYLIGKWKSKRLIILPSFIPLIAGTEISNSHKKDFSIISEKEMKKLKAYIIGEKKILGFGRLSSFD
jgi:putative SbcD/Mre11-related phosphoesterase|tara:strand:- start:11172 stop:11882 length:711 start_codon:yes stop_codon:yes gene_type:complete